MKLSELVHFRSLLDQHNVSQIARDARAELDKIHYTVDSQPVHVGQYQQVLDDQQKVIAQSFADYEQQLTKLKVELDQMIDQAEPAFFQESYRLYEEEMFHETPEYALNRRLPATPETSVTLRSRLMNYTNWQLPGIIIRPGLETFIDDMVSYDPLYLVDNDYAMLKPTVEKFPEAYQRRLRQYIINEQDESILNKIPKNQFGMCLIYNYLNFKPLEVIKRYLTEVYDILRPGGICILTFNDCDRAIAIGLVEQHFACYTPGRLIYDLARSLGYEVVFTWNDGEASTWLELRKPGELTSLRGGQTLAKIIPK
jgi:SAM-dependent methyltransferase